MKRIASPFSFGSMIDRVNCEGRRVLVKEEAKRGIKLGCAAAGALVAALLIATCPIPGLSYQATAVLGILIMAIVWWITGVLPEFVTAVVMAVLFVVVAGISVGATFSTFASSTWWLLLSAFTLGVGMKTSGLMRRIALAIVRKFPRTFRCQVIAQLVTGTVLGPLIPSLAVKGAMLAPLAMSIGDELGYERQGKRATGLFAAMLVGIRTVAPTIVSASVTGYALMATLPADVQEQFNMASWFVAALPWLVVVLALNYFLIMGMYGRGEASACDAVEDSPSDTVGAPGNAQSLEQSSLRCGTRFVGAAECADSKGVGALSGGDCGQANSAPVESSSSEENNQAARGLGGLHQASSAAQRGLSERLSVAARLSRTHRSNAFRGFTGYLLRAQAARCSRITSSFTSLNSHCPMSIGSTNFTTPPRTFLSRFITASMSSGAADQESAGSPSSSRRLSCARTTSIEVPAIAAPKRAAKRMPSATAAPWEYVP